MLLSESLKKVFIEGTVSTLLKDANFVSGFLKLRNCLPWEFLCVIICNSAANPALKSVFNKQYSKIVNQIRGI